MGVAVPNWKDLLAFKPSSALIVTNNIADTARGNPSHVSSPMSLRAVPKLYSPSTPVHRRSILPEPILSVIKLKVLLLAEVPPWSRRGS